MGIFHSLSHEMPSTKKKYKIDYLTVGGVIATFKKSISAIDAFVHLDLSAIRTLCWQTNRIIPEFRICGGDFIHPDAVIGRHPDAPRRYRVRHLPPL